MTYADDYSSVSRSTDFKMPAPPDDHEWRVKVGDGHVTVFLVRMSTRNGPILGTTMASQNQETSFFNVVEASVMAANTLIERYKAALEIQQALGVDAYFE